MMVRTSSNSNRTFVTFQKILVKIIGNHRLSDKYLYVTNGKFMNLIN